MMSFLHHFIKIYSLSISASFLRLKKKLKLLAFFSHFFPPLLLDASKWYLTFHTKLLSCPKRGLSKNPRQDTQLCSALQSSSLEQGLLSLASIRLGQTCIWCVATNVHLSHCRHQTPQLRFFGIASSGTSSTTPFSRDGWWPDAVQQIGAVLLVNCLSNCGCFGWGTLTGMLHGGCCGPGSLALGHDTNSNPIATIKKLATSPKMLQKSLKLKEEFLEPPHYPHNTTPVSWTTTFPLCHLALLSSSLSCHLWRTAVWGPLANYPIRSHLALSIIVRCTRDKRLMEMGWSRFEGKKETVKESEHV